MSRPKSKSFTTEVTYDDADYSETSTLKATPPNEKAGIYSADGPVELVVTGPGLLRDDVYDQQLPPWRAGLRRVLVANLGAESQALAWMQDKIRTPVLDTYFVYTSSLGTHTFFMTLLPAFFFFGHDSAGASLVQVLGLGVYFSSLIKDSICSPRPLAPPVTRLTMGTHHLEYGFPSTHSTNSISIALHFWSILYTSGASLSNTSYYVGCAALAWYAFSIVFGRLYCAMHSFTDVVAGVCLGAAIWVGQWTLGPLYEAWAVSPGYQVPAVIIPLILILVNQHPDPVDDCPCFEDAIAFLSVIMGTTLAAWWRANWGYSQASGYFVSRMPAEWMAWWIVASMKMVAGVLIIFTFRLVAKPILHAVLPPIFRGLAQLFKLPNRRFYTPATDYDRFPEEPLLNHPIPSMVDVSAAFKTGVDDGGSGLPVSAAGLKRRGNGRLALGEKPAGPVAVPSDAGTRVRIARPEEKEKVKHYDADVLTKVIVYAGIGFVASGLVPVMFEMLGWGVYR